MHTSLTAHTPPRPLVFWKTWRRTPAGWIGVNDPHAYPLTAEGLRGYEESARRYPRFHSMSAYRYW